MYDQPAIPTIRTSYPLSVELYPDCFSERKVHKLKLCQINGWSYKDNNNNYYNTTTACTVILKGRYTCIALPH